MLEAVLQRRVSLGVHFLVGRVRQTGQQTVQVDVTEVLLHCVKDGAGRDVGYLDIEGRIRPDQNTW